MVAPAEVAPAEVVDLQQGVGRGDGGARGNGLGGTDVEKSVIGGEGLWQIRNKPQIDGMQPHLYHISLPNRVIKLSMR